MSGRWPWSLPPGPLPEPQRHVGDHGGWQEPGTRSCWDGHSPTLPPPRHLQEPQQTLEAMLRPKVTTLPGHIQAVYVQNVVKLYAAILQQKEQAADVSAAQEVTQLLVERLPQFVQSADLEVQERVSTAARPPEGSLGGALLWFSHSWPGAGWASLEPLCWGGPRWSHRRSLAKGDGGGRR